MAFNQLEYQRRIKQDNPSFREGGSSLGAINKLVARNAPASEVKQALSEMPPHKIQQYQHSIRYLIDFYPGWIDVAEMLAEDHRVMKDGQPVTFQLSVGDEHRAHGDLLYGVHPSRTLDVYKMVNAGKLSICDNYNNAAEIGTGLAFGRTWDGNGLLDTRPEDVARMVTSKAANSDAPCATHDLQPGRFASYARGLMNSRYSPADTLELPDSRVQKDTHHTLDEIRKVNSRAAKKEIKLHHMAHAHFFKAVRRACKGGIAMAASAPEFTATGARVHFLLDGLGDLGKIARKEIFNKCTPITSSELAFCFRYWDRLQHVVRFYLNGIEVKAPWEAEWTANDANNKPVSSNKEAWLRYGWYRKLTARNGKSFPSGWAVQPVS
ncbi:hypothetical protein [Spongorhabdus nitratireducens]